MHVALPNKTIALAVRREMPEQPDDVWEWRRLFLETARKWRDEMANDKDNDMSRTIKALDRVIAYYT